MNFRRTPTLTLHRDPKGDLCRRVEKSMPAEMVRYDPAPEREGVIAARESLEPEGAGQCHRQRTASLADAHNGLTPRRDGDDYHEGPLSVSRQCGAICAARVKHADCGMRRPRVAGRADGRGMRLATHRQARPCIDAKELPAKARYASSTRHRIGSTRSRGTLGSGVASSHDISRPSE